MSRTLYCGHCGGPLVLDPHQRCLLCLRQVVGAKDAPICRSLEEAVEHYERLRGGLGTWLTLNYRDIAAQYLNLSYEDQRRPFGAVGAEYLAENPINIRPMPFHNRVRGRAQTPRRGRPLQTWHDAEDFAEDWLRKNGFPDALKTPPGNDGGIDIVGKNVVAQVKHHATKVPLQEVQRLSGIAHAEGKQAIFFSLNGYTRQAREWADQHGVRCLIYRARK